MADEWEFIGPEAPAGIDTDTEWEWGDGSVDTSPRIWPDSVENQGAFEFTEWIWRQIQGDLDTIAEVVETGSVDPLLDRGQDRIDDIEVDGGALFVRSTGGLAADLFRGFFGISPLTFVVVGAGGYYLYKRWPDISKRLKR